jgi:hypothetical protein
MSTMRALTIIAATWMLVPLLLAGCPKSLETPTAQFQLSATQGADSGAIVYRGSGLELSSPAKTTAERVQQAMPETPASSLLCVLAVNHFFDEPHSA